MSTIAEKIICPVCSTGSPVKIFQVKDYSVSGEMFDVLECKNCGLRVTYPVPGIDRIRNYYQSEDYISHHNASKGIVNSLYRLVRKFTVRKKRQLIKKISGKEHGLLLDVGSGTGFFPAEMIKAGWVTTGLEPDEQARVAALSLNRIELLPSENLYQLPEKTFDVITLWHVLEHVHDLYGYMQQFKKLMKPDGLLLIAVPNFSSHDASVYGNFWAAYDVPRHLYHFNPAAMKVLAERSGLIVHNIKPMWFDSFYVSLLSSRYRYGSVKWISAVHTAILSNMKARKEISKCSSLIYVLKNN